MPDFGFRITVDLSVSELHEHVDMKRKSFGNYIQPGNVTETHVTAEPHVTNQKIKIVHFYLGSEVDTNDKLLCLLSVL